MLFKEPPFISFIVLSLFSVLPFQGWGQDYEYIQYTTKDGLPSNYVYGVVEDDEGYIWAYTENGLSKFDGYTFQNYSTKDGLPGNDVTYAEKDAQGVIWLNIYQKGIAYLYEDSIKYVQDTYDTDYHLEGTFYDYAMYRTINNYYAITHKNQYIYDRLYLSKKPPSFFLDSLNQIYSWKRSIKWPTGDFSIFKENLLVLRNNNTFKILTYEEKLINISSSYIKHLRGTNSFLLGNISGNLILVDFDKKRHERLDLDQYKLSPKAYVHPSIFQSTFIVNTDVGFLEFDFEGRLVMKLVLEQLANQYALLRVFKDSNGNLWVGSRQGGLFFLPRQFLTTISFNNTDSENNSFEHFYLLNDKDILCITDQVGVFLYQDDHLESLIPSSNKRFRSIQNTSIGLFVYDGLDGKILKKENNSWQEASIKSVFKNAWAFKNGKLEKYIGSDIEDYGGRRNLLFLPDKNILFQGISNWLDVIQFNQNGQHLIKRQSHISDFLFYHKEQDLVISGNKEGLFTFQEERFIPFLENFSLLKNIDAIAGSNNDLWINSEDEGVFHYQFLKKKLTKLYQFPMVRKIKEDSDSTLFIVTNKGVKIISKYKPDSSPITEFTTLDGLPSNDIRDIHPIGDSILLVATFEGVHKIDRRLKQAVLLSPKALSIKTFKINNQLYPIDSLPPFSHRQNNLETSFHLQDYASSGNITYSFRLDPVEEKWRNTKERIVRYPSLAPGHYTFHLKAQNAYGQQIEAKALAFSIRPPFWKRAWFLTLSGFILMAGIVLLIRYRDRLQQIKLAEEKRLNQKVTQLELSSLKAQLNPHFVFNALGSIQYFIQNQDAELADDYLAKFAKLMRMYLDSSNEKMIPLQQELNLLRIYTDLEKMRFEDNFDVRIIKDSGLDENHYYLPSMIIQPLIENAINHGLGNRRDGKGVLEVLFKEERQRLVCYINDNGIGRTNAARLRNKGHQSRGLELIKEKIQTLQIAGIAKVDMRISDLNPKNDSFPGTQVKLVIENYEDHED